MEDRKILVIEDETAIADILVFNLEREGYKVEQANDGAEGLEKALKGDNDLILLDVMLPSMNGFEICKGVREKSNVPIIMLTAREEENDKVLGLELGADDYITKPFSMKELMARIRANMRRVPQVTTEKSNFDIVNGGLSIDNDRGEIIKNGIAIELTVREFDLIKFLSTQAERIFSREELMEKVWGYEFYGDLRAVDVAIRRLREKIEEDPARPEYIITKRGQGYYFTKKAN